MKRLKTRFLSAMLALLTLLTLLPTSALAASGSGTGIKATTNPNLWSTRLTSTGQNYSYRPPTAAGKQLYCMDLGYSYRYGTASFLNSYTYKTATGTDSDALWDAAVADTGLGEMDAVTKENVKWMVTYIVDYKGDIPGSLFMALQTYIWDHQSNKASGGDSSGDIDAGGFANADTYETYLGYVDWLLAQKAKEDAEYQKQIEEYAAKGIIASVVEDDTAKWAVYAKSSVSGRQGFFAYYAPRKLAVNDAPLPDKPSLPAGDADITLKKVVAGTTRGLNGAKFNIYRDGQIVGSSVTSGGGIIEVNDVTKGLWSFVEVEAPAGYCADPTPISVYVDTTDGDKQYTVTAENYELPSMKIIKTDAQTGASIPNAVFSIKSVTGTYSTSVKTGTDGSATLSVLPAGVYVVREESVPEPYVVSNTEQTVALRPGKTSEVRFQDYQKPGLEILKKNIATGEPIESVTYHIEQVDGSFSTSATTDSHGRIFLEDIPVGTYKVTEVNVPANVILSDIPQTVALKAGCTSTVTFFNAMKPSLTILKRNSVTGNALSGAKFHIYYGSDNTTTGEINDLGVFTTDESGKIILTEVNRGWYKLVEEAAPSGFGIQGSGITEFYLEANTSKTVTVDNIPHSALVVYKYDAKTGKGLEGCRFELRHLSGNTSGTGGMAIGTYVTGPNGAFTVTGLKKGTYVCQEIESDGNHIIDREPQTVWISGEEQDVVTLRFGNAPLGSLLITKLSDDSKREPLSGVEFLLTDSSGSYLGNDNGRFTTNAAGEILVDGLEPGMTVIAREVRAKSGYLLDNSPQHALIKSGETAHLQFLNQPAGNLIIRKTSSGPNKEPLEGVEFKITYADGCFVPNANGELSSNGLYYTDSNGEIRISGIVGTVVVTETKTIPGYTIDENTRPQTVVVQPNDTQTLYFTNTPSTTLVIEKYIEGTATPLKGVTFLVTDSSGAVVGKSNGEYITDENGRIVIEDLEPGMTVTARETKAPEGYVLDTTPKSIQIKAGEVQTLRFYNQKQGTLVVKKLDSVTKKPLSGVEFELTYADGGYVDDANGYLSSKGLYTTDSNGEIRVSGITGTIVVKETKTIDGYTIDPATQTQTVVVNPADTQTLTFYNTPIGGLQIIKSDEDSGKRISGVQFEIRKMNGEIIGSYTTDSNGVIQLPELERGWYTATELKAASGYLLDTTPHRIEVKDGQTATLEITNHKSSRILLHKVDKATGKGIYGAVFLLYDSNHNPIGEYVTDQDGYLYADEGLEDGRYYLREIKAADGYVLDPELKTIYVRYGSTTEIEWSNTAECGQIQIIKKSADDNVTNGLPAGTLLEGAVFEIYDRAGNVVDTIKSDRNGRAVSKTLPLSRYTVREIKAPANYSINPTVMTAYLEFNGQIVTFEVQNTSVSTGVSIKKTGPVQAVPGQPIRYVFSQIKNSSNVALDSFYWRDQLPAQVTLSKIVTGSYNQPLSYKVVYKTNLSGDYRTLADNLSTSKVYVLDARPAVLGLAANERVTEVMFVFGNVKAGFAQVETPYIYATARSGLANNSSIVNVADVGGLYNGQWIQAVSRWLTTVYTKTTVKLPKTGY